MTFPAPHEHHMSSFIHNGSEQPWWSYQFSKCVMGEFFLDCEKKRKFLNGTTCFSMAKKHWLKAKSNSNKAIAESSCAYWCNSARMLQPSLGNLPQGFTKHVGESASVGHALAQLLQKGTELQYIYIYMYNKYIYIYV